MTSQMRIDTVPVIRMSAMNSASTCPATVDALSGQSGNSLYMTVAPLLADHHDDEAGQHRDSGDAAGADEIHCAAAVTTGGGIVVVAEEQNLIGYPTDLSFRRFDDAEAQIARFELETEK